MTAQDRPVSQPSSRTDAPQPPGRNVSVTVQLPEATVALLRDAALARTVTKGGETDVSLVLAELIERHRGELEQYADTVRRKRRLAGIDG